MATMWIGSDAQCNLQCACTQSLCMLHVHVHVRVHVRVYASRDAPVRVQPTCAHSQ